jgi:hypothetical protein
MLRAINRLIEALFAPVFELLGNVPPRELHRLFATF